MCPGEDDADPKSSALKWLRNQGYPLEFRVAHEFAKRGFVLWPSYFAPPSDSDPAREIDLRAARLRTLQGGASVGVEFAVECKWTGDAPWIAFVSEYAQIATSMAVTNTCASPSGHALLWLLADHRPDALGVFEVPQRPAYAGVRAHKTSSKDMVYGTLQGLVELMQRIYQPMSPGLGDMRAFDWCTVALPLVVIHGKLFEAWYDVNHDDVELTEVPRTRFYWTGTGLPGVQPLIDVVTREALPALLDERTAQAELLINQLELARHKVLEAFAARSLDPLAEYIGNRYSGRPIDLPPALRPCLFP